MTRIIAITSGKGGVGKTMVTANIGSALALMGKKVCLIDFDFGLRNLDILLGLSNRIIFDIMDVALGFCSIEQALIKDKYCSSLYLIPGSKSGLLKESNIKVLQQVISTITAYHNFDYILIDSPSGIENGFRTAVSVAKEVIVVVTPDRTSIQDADRVIGIIENELASPPLIVINRYQEANVKKLNMTNIDYILKILNENLVGVILEDEEVIKSVHYGKTIALNPELENGLRFRYIARNILNHTFHEFIQVNNPIQKFKLGEGFNKMMKFYK